MNIDNFGLPAPLDTPNNRLSARERYQRDPWFHALVTSLFVMIRDGGDQTTPTELREALMLALLMHEEQKPRQWMVSSLDAEGLK